MNLRRGLHVRIGAGEFKGRGLTYPAESNLRPTMQKTKASLFSALGPALRGCIFVDLFAGAGAVGLEALSRGAAFAYFVEGSDTAVAALRANLAACAVASERYAIHAGDVCDVLRSPTPHLARATIIFADPPYNDDVLGAFFESVDGRHFSHLQIFALEHASRTPVLGLNGLVLTKTRRFGDTCLSYFSPEEG